MDPGMTLSHSTGPDGAIASSAGTRSSMSPRGSTALKYPHAAQFKERLVTAGQHSLGDLPTVPDILKRALHAGLKNSLIFLHM